MKLTFLGTGGAWGVPELNCNCLICQEMRKAHEKRDRTSLLLSNKSTLLIDCGPDIRDQLMRNEINRLDGILITHEHGDHFIGLDEILAYKRNFPREDFKTIPLFVTEKSWEVIGVRFSYLVDMGLIEIKKIKAGEEFCFNEYNILPFKTYHGEFAKGSVGFIISFNDSNNKKKIIYTSDFLYIPEFHQEMYEPDYLIIQSFWLNEPEVNRANHMSFQNALDYIKRFSPKKETFLIHIGDADMVPGDSANVNAKKYKPKSPIRLPNSNKPYPIPLNHSQWQETIDRIIEDYRLGFKITVSKDDMEVIL